MAKKLSSSDRLSSADATGVLMHCFFFVFLMCCLQRQLSTGAQCAIPLPWRESLGTGPCPVGGTCRPACYTPQKNTWSGVLLVCKTQQTGSVLHAVATTPTCCPAEGGWVCGPKIPSLETESPQSLKDPKATPKTSVVKRVQNLCQTTLASSTPTQHSTKEVCGLKNQGRGFFLQQSPCTQLVPLLPGKALTVQGMVKVLAELVKTEHPAPEH